MLQHAQELVHNINAVVPASAPEEEPEDGEHDLEIYSDDDDDAMEL